MGSIQAQETGHGVGTRNGRFGGGNGETRAGRERVDLGGSPPRRGDEAGLKMLSGPAPSEVGTSDPQGERSDVGRAAAVLAIVDALVARERILHPESHGNPPRCVSTGG